MDEVTTPLRDGATVVIVGLKGRSELNGRRGSVLSFNAEKGRHAVDLSLRGGQLTAEKVLLHPVNLRQEAEPPPASAPCEERGRVNEWEDEMIDLVSQL